MKWKQSAAKAVIAAMIFSVFPNNAFAAGWIQSTSPPTQKEFQSGWWYSTNDLNTTWYAAVDEKVPLWQWLDGNKDTIAECYAFNKDGWMYADTVTPDGYTVNKNGAWTVDGVVQTKSVFSVSGSSNRVVGSGGGGGGGSGSSGGSGSTSRPDNENSTKPDNPDPGTNENVTYSYTVRYVTEDGTTLKEVKGTAKPNADIEFAIEEIKGYQIVSGQELSAALTEDGMVFTVVYEKIADTATDSNAEKLYSYSIEYRDAKSKLVLASEIGKAEKGTVIEVLEKEIEGYELLPDQVTEFKLVSDKMTQKIYYQNVTVATPSAAQKVDWTIHFVEQDDHSKKLWKSQSGTIQDEGTLTINFPSVIYGNDGEIWESIEEPPIERTIYGPGRHIEYIEFVNTGNIPEETDPDEAAKELLKDYLQTAKEVEAEITGEETEKIPDNRFYVTNQSSNDYRVRSIATQINDTADHTFYVIGKNFIPNGKTIAEWFGEDAVYANLLEQVITIGNDTYYVARMSVQRSYSSEGCDHNWNIERDNDATCLGKGRIVYVCTKCGEEREVVTAPLGHIDKDGDSICDRCDTRAFLQEIGSKITAKISGKTMTFTCVDDDYLGGMLYFADSNLPDTVIKDYGTAEYETSNVYRYFRDGFQNAFSIKNGMIGITSSGGTAYAMSLTKADYEAYKDKIEGANFLLQDSEDGKVAGVDSTGSFTLEDPQQTSFGIRPAIILEKPDAGTADRIHWNIGDLQAREIDGKTYIFRCIDQNYSDASANHRQAALFLADSVIPANYGSDYKVKQQADGSHKYEFVPGPIVNFGENNDYKYSKLRSWLKKSKDSLFNTEPISIGVDYAFMGSTAEKEYSAFDANSISSYYIGDQQLKEQLFILSVDEAVKYKDYLWKFEGSEEDNPDSQYSAFSKGYWLRSPMGNSDDYDTGYAYVVDLINGNIHPSAISPQQKTGNDELDVTTTYGIRPAFTMPQD